MDSDESVGDLTDFDPQINIFEVGQKIRKLSGYVTRAERRLSKRRQQLEKLSRISAEEEKLLEIGIRLVDPDKIRGEHA